MAGVSCGMTLIESVVLSNLKQHIMPLSTDNQDYAPNDVVRNKDGTSSETLTGPALGNMPLGKDVGNTATSEKAMEDENNFDSDSLKGKKIDGDPSKESDQPAKLNQD